jgi:hypothetical protein
MSERTRALERSLRDGPPDESGYVARSYEPAIELWHTGPTTIGQLERVVPSRRGRLPIAMSVQPAIALVLVVAIGLAGIAILGRHDLPGVNGPAVVPTPPARSSPSPSPTPSPSLTLAPAPPSGAGPAGAAIPIPALTRTFVSSRNGFSVMYPAGWTVKPATTSWRPDTFLPLGNPALDDLQRPGIARLAVASHRLAAGQTEQQWLAAYQPVYQASTGCAGTAPSTWPRIAIGGDPGYLATADCPLGPDVSPASPGVEFDAFAFSGGRIYMIKLFGKVDLAYFQAMLATFHLDPPSAIDPPG